MKNKKIIFSLLMVVVVLVISELALQIIAAFSIKVNDVLSRKPTVIKRHIDDPILGNRPNPEYIDHDEWGFRNDHVPQKADIVILGDSQTYGEGVKKEEAWPYLLRKLLNKEVYNISYGSYSPVHSLLLLDKAISLNPEIIIEVLYSGNDLYESYHHVYDLGQLESLKSFNNKILEEIKRLQDEDPLEKKVEENSPFEIVEHKNPYHGEFREYFARHSKLYGLLRALKRKILSIKERLKETSDKSWEELKLEAKEKGLRTLEYDSGKTILTPKYRSIALDFDDLRIKEGQRISLKSMIKMNEILNQKNIKFLVICIPTKELVFKEEILSTGIKDENLQKLLRNEEKFWEVASNILDNDYVEHINVLGVLRQAIKKGNNPYPINSDSHPNVEGHRIIAQFISEWLKNEGGY